MSDAARQVSREADLPERKVTINQLVGHNLACYRKAAGLTQEELGKRLGGWTKVAVSAAERSWDGRRVRKFDADELMALATALGVPITAFFLPPEDAGTGVRYVLDGPGFPDLISLLPGTTPPRDGDSRPMQAYRKRLMALGAREDTTGASYVESAEQRRKSLFPKEWRVQEVQRFRKAIRDEEVAERTVRVVEEILAEALERAQALERDAEDRHRQAVGSLVEQREYLERRVDDLRAFEREYRSRLVAYLEGQLSDLKVGSTDAATFRAVAGPVRTRQA